MTTQSEAEQVDIQQKEYKNDSIKPMREDIYNSLKYLGQEHLIPHYKTQLREVEKEIFQSILYSY